jgi:hypothetical protein
LLRANPLHSRLNEMPNKITATDLREPGTLVFEERLPAAPAGLEITHKSNRRKVALAGDFARVFEFNVLKAWDAAHQDDITERSKLD